MQWVTDYGAVTRRAGSTPEERVKRRHFRYQGGQDWRMDTIISSLPIALHLSVLLFFIGLIAWMWDTHRSVFAVVVVCGVAASLFYLLTTILAIFYPSCPYRTPLAGWIYVLLHVVTTIIPPFRGSAEQEAEPERENKGGTTTSTRRTFKLRRFLTTLWNRFAQPSLTSRDDIYIQSPDKTLMLGSLIWLSNHISISQDVYRRLLTLINGFSATIDENVVPSISIAVPWIKIFRSLGSIYETFVQNLDLDESQFMDFSLRTQCLTQPGLREIVRNLSKGEVNNANFPVRLLYAWTKSTSSHTTDALRKQRFSDEVSLQDLIGSISSNPQNLLEIWYSLLDDEEKTCQDILPRLLGEVGDGSREKGQTRFDLILYLISTGRLPWDSSVVLRDDYGLTRMLPATRSRRRTRMIDWVDSLRTHPHKENILFQASRFKERAPLKVILIQNEMTGEEEAELKRMLIRDFTRWTNPESMLYYALFTFDQVLADTRSQEGSASEQDMVTWIIHIIYNDLVPSGITFDPECLGDTRVSTKRQNLSNILLRMIAYVTLGLEWDDEWLPKIIEAKKSAGYTAWRLVTKVCFRDPPFSDGDCTRLWRLRLRLWIHFECGVTSDYLLEVMRDLERLKRVEREIQCTQLGVDRGGDFLLALFHLNYAYGWNSTSLPSHPFIPCILIGDNPFDILTVSKDCIKYLSSICEELSTDPSRLIRLLIELVRADINHEAAERRPSTFFKLLKYAKVHLSNKTLRLFSLSCRRLKRYIKISYKQFEDNWEMVTGRSHSLWDERADYQLVDRGELKAVHEDVVLLLESAEGSHESEGKDISWPKNLLRPTGQIGNSFEDEQEEAANLRELRGEESDDMGNGFESAIHRE
ncbi:hypothetical protein FRC17_004800 [Serendipita sp. 399]|nr:hypothetical protein FRC17_004800 [Serendipita sp. 399]